MEKFDRVNNDLRKKNLRLNELLAIYWGGGDAISMTQTLLTLVVCIIYACNGWITVGTLIVFTSTLGMLLFPIRQLGRTLSDAGKAMVSMKRVQAILHEEAEPDEPNALKPDLHGDIVFDHVSFAYGSQPVLSDVTFSAKPGQTVAIMGPTGSGKTTLIQLLARCYDVTSGSISVDGCNVRKWKLQQLRDGIGTATQDVFLFSDTVEGNIAFGDQTLTEDEVHDFARRAAADDFIKGLSEGYDTIIGERGVGLSGGQKQRIALARALAVKPGILVMDDTTSAVDMETEKYIQAQLRQLPYDCTKLIIAQRISSVKDADLILILKDGVVTERGTHQELLRQRGYYYETYCLQNGITPDTAPQEVM